jgi:hypothetical protein
MDTKHIRLTPEELTADMLEGPQSTTGTTAKSVP